MLALPLMRFVLSSLSVLTISSAPGATDSTAARVKRYERDYGSAALVHANIPSFSRQTGLACSECHTSFPQLNSFGRAFKLNGYVLTDAQTVTAGDSTKRQTLKLNLIPMLSAEVQSSFTQVQKVSPGTQNGTLQFPQVLSLFVGGAIAPRLGIYAQITYDPRMGGIGMDMAELRYADHTTLGGKPLVYGFSLNNNPTLQDVWNSVPAWGFPFATSSVAPTPTAATMLDGAFAQQAAGLGAYALLGNHLYGEFSVYRSAQQGAAAPSDTASTNTISGAAPYWRAFYKQTFGQQTLMVGTLGMKASVFPLGVTGLKNQFTDIAFDAQYERPIGEGTFAAHAIWIHEQQKLDADVAAGTASNPTNTLKTFRFDASAYTRSMIGLTAGYFSTNGTSDALRFPVATLTGSAAGSPNSQGFIAELSALPWQNTRFEVQYVMYNKFNGSGVNYDGAGRNASHNNTLYLLSWVAF